MHLYEKYLLIAPLVNRSFFVQIPSIFYSFSYKFDYLVKFLEVQLQELCNMGDSVYRNYRLIIVIVQKVISWNQNTKFDYFFYYQKNIYWNPEQIYSIINYILNKYFEINFILMKDSWVEDQERESLLKERELVETNIKINQDTNVDLPVLSFLEEFSDKVSQHENMIMGFLGDCFIQLEKFSSLFQESEVQQDYPMEKVESQRKMFIVMIQIYGDIIETFVTFFKTTVEKESQKPDLKEDLEFFCNMIQQYPVSRIEYTGNQNALKNLRKIADIFITLTSKLFEQIKSKNLKKEGEFLKYCEILLCLGKELGELALEKEFTKKFLDYDPYKIQVNKATTQYKTQTIVNVEKKEFATKEKHYYQAEEIIFQKPLEPQNLYYVEPPLHRQYIAEASKAYHQLVPVKITNIVLQEILQQKPEMNTVNYFSEECADKILHYFQPGTKNLIFYNLLDIYDSLSIPKQLQNVTEIKINFLFSQETRSIIAPTGKIYITGARSKNRSYDHSFFEYSKTDDTFRSRPNIPVPKKEHSMIYLNGYIYVIGGSTKQKKCSSICHRYNIKRKQWSEVGNTNFAIRNAAVCASGNRYIFRFGGLNEFDYIDKNIQAYDNVNNGWSIVRTYSKYVTEEIEVLYNSFAVPLNENSIYIFGGNNLNNFQTDTGYLLEITDIKQKKRKPSKIEGLLRSLKDTKRTIMSFSGEFVKGSQLVHHNSIYFMRKKNY